MDKAEKANNRPENKEKGKVKHGTISSIFMHADRVDKCLMSIGFVGAVLDGITDRLRSLFTGRMVNAIGSASTLDANTLRQDLDKNAVGLIYLACFSFVACFLEGYCWTRTGERQAARMRSKYLKAILRQDPSHFDLDTTASSEVMTTIANDIFIVQDAIAEKVPELVCKLSIFFGGIILAMVVVWRLTMTALPAMLLMVLFIWFSGKYLLELSGNVKKEYIKAGTIAEQAISSIRTVYAFGGEKKTLQEFTTILDNSLALGLKQGLVKGLTVSSTTIVYATWALMCYYVCKLVMNHNVQGGDIYVVGISILTGAQALGTALSNMKDLVEASCASRHITKAIKQTPKIDSEDNTGTVLENVCGQLKFENVHFSYPSRMESVVFEDFSLTISARKVVAIVGASGSGKSTILSLIQRFYDPLEGNILLDGVSIDKLQLKWLRSQMALVSQEPSLFSTSIKENILFGKEDANMEEILEASKLSDAHDFISELPQGYDTQVGERGLKLSGGQKQRIAIARAIIKNPRILLLDEATSALDSHSERVVQEAMDKLAKGRTTIIVAHRLSTIKNADMIVVVENGQVKEIGSHDDLIEKEDGFYSSLVRAQQMDEEKKLPKKELDNTKIECRLEEGKQNPVNHATPSSTSVDEISTYSDESKMSDLQIIWRFLSLFKSEWKQTIIGCFSAILSGTIRSLFSVAMGITISVYFLTDPNEIQKRIMVSVLWFLGLAVFSFLVYMSQHYCFGFSAIYFVSVFFG